MIPLSMLVQYAPAARSAAGEVESLDHVAQPAARAENAMASGASGQAASGILVQGLWGSDSITASFTRLWRSPRRINRTCGINAHRGEN